MTKNIWNKPGIPHKGWACVNVVDTGKANSKCEMCGNGTVRYLHYLEHDDYEGQIKVGSECSMKMAENYSSASIVEHYTKRYPQEKAKWTTKNWKLNRNNNLTLTHGEYRITIFKDKNRPGYFKFMTVKEEYTNNFDGEGFVQEVEEVKYFNENSYASMHEAREAVAKHFTPLPEEFASILKKDKNEDNL